MDERKLQAIYVILEGEMEQGYVYDAATISMVHERRQTHLEGISKSYSTGASINFVHKQAK